MQGPNSPASHSADFIFHGGKINVRGITQLHVFQLSVFLIISELQLWVEALVLL